MEIDNSNIDDILFQKIADKHGYFPTAVCMYFYDGYYFFDFDRKSDHNLVKKISLKTELRIEICMLLALGKKIVFCDRRLEKYAK